MMKQTPYELTQKEDETNGQLHKHENIKIFHEAC